MTTPFSARLSQPIVASALEGAKAFERRWAQLVIKGIVGGERQVSKGLAFRSS